MSKESPSVLSRAEPNDVSEAIDQPYLNAQSPLPAGLAGASFTTSKPLTLDLVLGYASRL
jgi:hypothetical protein